MIKRDIGIVENIQETSLDTGIHNRAITVLHERVLESRDTPIAGNNLIPISVPFQCSCVGYHTVRCVYRDCYGILPIH